MKIDYLGVENESKEVKDKKKKNTEMHMANLL